jgi:hypothetical protein
MKSVFDLGPCRGLKLTSYMTFGKSLIHFALLLSARVPPMSVMKESELYGQHYLL